MRTSTRMSSAPVMPTVWPQSGRIRPVKRCLLNTVDEPRNADYYLESPHNVSSDPDRGNVLKEFFRKTHV